MLKHSNTTSFLKVFTAHVLYWDVQISLKTVTTKTAIYKLKTEKYPIDIC